MTQPQAQSPNLLYTELAAFINGHSGHKALAGIRGVLIMGHGLQPMVAVKTYQQARDYLGYKEKHNG